MQTESLFQLLNPLFFLLLAGGFFSIARMSEEARSAAWFGAAFLAATLAFSLEYIGLRWSTSITVFFTQGAYTLSATLFAIGLSCRAGRTDRHTRFALLGMGVLGCILVGLSLADSVLKRTLVSHFGNGLIFALAVWHARARRETWRDQLILLLSSVHAAQFFIRPLMVHYFIGSPATRPEYYASDVFLLFHLTVGVCSLMIAVLLIVDYAHGMLDSFRKDAMRDRLTELYNRRGFEVETEKIMRQADLSLDAMCLVMADLDLFKRINDTHGHGVGDQVIRAFGHLIEAHAGEGAIAARIGGEEFIVTLPGSDLQTAEMLAEVMRKRLERQTLSVDGVSIQCTASFGVALRQRGEVLSSAMARADKALYLAKASGRNLVRTQADIDIAHLRIAGAELGADALGTLLDAGADGPTSEENS